jgi:myo-inositol-1(or 4)-monophosphatase
MNLNELAYNTAIEAALAASEVMLPWWPNPTNRLFNGKDLDTITKEGIGNYATVADLESEKRIIEVIQSKPEFRSHGILAEETDEITGDGEWRWIVDPIDGTINFRNGNADFGICIALFQGNTPIAGIIAMPALRQLVSAGVGQPAKLMSYDKVELGDLQSLARRFPDPLDNALVGYNVGYQDRIAQMHFVTNKVVEKVGNACCLGSYSTGNFRLVQGMMGICFGLTPTAMDISLAAALIPAVGGVITDLDGDEIDWTAKERTYLGAVNARLHDEFLTAINS